jgi:tripeptide aminopeptidase
VPPAAPSLAGPDSGPPISGLPISGVDADTVVLPPVAERFARYVRIDTTSDPDSDATPSTARQLDLCRLLVDELRAMGVADAEMDASGVVYATLPGTVLEAPVVALCAHVDTSPDAPGAGVRPLVHAAWSGAAFALPGDPSVVFDATADPNLAAHIGHDLLTSDGTTLLGSDDKAGVAVLMQLAADLLASDVAARAEGRPATARPTLRLLFTPDEEIGRGADPVDLDRLAAHVGYTLDGSGTDRLNAETFNAAEAVVTVEGVGVHPGYAQGILVNALRVVAHVVALLPASEAPETTDDRDGFFHPHTLSGEAERASLRVLLRDFSDVGLERRRMLVRDAAAQAEAAYPGSTVRVEIRESYRNMAAHIDAVDPRAVTIALDAARAMGFEMALKPVRGGTDGARLSERGLPTPNVFTGGHAFHSRREWNTVQNLARSLAYTHALVAAWAHEPRL